MTEPMTDAEVKQAIERHCLTVSYTNFSFGTYCYVHGWRQDGDSFSVIKPTLTEAVAEVVRQIEETQE